MVPFVELTAAPPPDRPTPAGAEGPDRVPPGALLAPSTPAARETSSTPRVQPPDQGRTARPTTPSWPEGMLVFLVSALAFLLASVPARNSDLWMHLARGRILAGGEYSFGTDPRLPAGLPVQAPWLYDLLTYDLYAALGGPALVLVKALLVVALALVLLRLSWAGTGWWVPAFCTTLALLATSTRLLLQPATVSYLFLALTLWFLREPSRHAAQAAAVREAAGATPAPRLSPLLPPWPLLVLFVVWVNADLWFVLGLAIVALTWLGEVLDEIVAAEGQAALRRGGWLEPLLRQGCRFALLAAVCLLNPAHVFAFALPPELDPSAAPRGSAVTSPFHEAYFANLGLTPAGLAYFPLLGLSLLSFVGNLPRPHARRFFPWLGLALLTAWQVRTVPFFAIVAGPVLAWNLQEYWSRGFTADRVHAPIRWECTRAGHLLTTVLVGVLPVCAWPGWLQVPPFEPRRWAVEPPPALEEGAAATREWIREHPLEAGARGLHLSRETAYAFAWFCPDLAGLWDARLASVLRGDRQAPADYDRRLRAAGINHVILYDPDHGRLSATLERLLGEPERWPVLFVKGDLAVFGWRDPAAPEGTDPFRAWQLDLNHLAFHPRTDKKAPSKAPDGQPETRAWWEAFWKPVLPRPVDQEEATLHLFHAEALRRSAPLRHFEAWESSQSAALVFAAGGWGSPAGAFLDARLRLTLLQPRTTGLDSRFDTLPGPDQLVYSLLQQFAQQRDDTPPALLYMAVRAARRALAVNPDDAQAYLVLGESYQRLLHSTRERVWGKQLPELVHLRRAQAIAALNQAITLKPDFAQAHLTLSQLYAEMAYLDLTLHHRRTYLQLIQAAGLLSLEQQVQEQAELRRLAAEVRKREDLFEVATAGWKVKDRAFRAWQEGLAGKARDMLLETDIAAFGPQGMALELELLLRTGRAKDVWEWTSPEHKAALGASYHWLRVQALAARGDYALAREECNRLAPAGAPGPHGSEGVPLREIMAGMIGQMVLDEQPGGRCPPDLLRRARSRYEFQSRIRELAKSLRLGADVTVLRGLLALEEGAVDEAEIAFRQALTLWKDAATAASGGGLDFNAHAIARGCLELLE
jgi:tetratricopeptide (TPR) repeat protein